LRQAQPKLVIVALNCGETEEDLLPLLEAGISGFVPNEASDAQVLQTIRAALEGEVYCPPKIVAALIRRVQRSEETQGTGSTTNPQLTPRQAQVARYLEEGLSNKEIAARLGLETSTAKNHVHSILHKLAIHRRGEAVQQLRLGDSLRPVARDREVTDFR
jgi:DNA-binding NarL/FixJ family response regulator